MPAIIDTHCHLDFDVFDADRDAVLERCKANNIEDIFVPAVSAATWPRTIAVCAQHANAHLALGMHPVFIDQHQPQHLNELNDAVKQHRPIAIGEIGLDYFLKELDQEKQQLFFSKQLIIANQHTLPVIIHNRKAHDDCLRALSEIPVSGGIIHAFNGSIQQAEKYIELGFLLGFGGMLTFARSSKLRGLLKRLPMHAIALETDAPDMTVVQYRGERNSPEYIVHVLEAVADIKGLTKEAVIRACLENVKRTFPLFEPNNPSINA